MKTKALSHTKASSLSKGIVVMLFACVAMLAMITGCDSPSNNARAPSQTSVANNQGTPPEKPESNAFGIQKDSGKLEIGFITVGPVSDWGYNYQHNQGRLGMEARLRDKVHTVIVENIPETADVERVMQRMCDSGASLIFSTSYGYIDSSLRVADKYPSVTFMQPFGADKKKNLGTYNADTWEPAYICGVVAAMTAKNEKRFGVLTSHPVPPVKWIFNAFCLGAQSINPDITVDVVYTGSWNDPAAETEAAKSMAAEGVKVLYVLTDSPIAGVQTAEREGIYSLAQHADLSSFAPKKWITGTVWNWSSLYIDVVNDMMVGKWESKHYSGGFAEDYVDIAPFGPEVPQEAREKARNVIKRLAEDQLSVFQGPIYDKMGTLRVPEGTALQVSEILGMDWEVRGVRAAQ